MTGKALSTVMARATKKMNVIIFLVALGLCLFPCAGVQAGTDPPSLDILAGQLTSPELLEKHMKKKFHYVSDKVLFGEAEYWQTPSETAARYQGDCEDYALFAQFILKKNTYDAFIVSVYWNSDAHTVAVFKNEAKWGIFNLADLSYTNAVSMKDLANAVNRDWSSITLMRQEGVTGVIARKFQGNLADRSKVDTVLTAPARSPA